MNKQGKGKIEWTDYTLNIVTGCEYNCAYGPDGCYANKLSQWLYPEKFKPTFRPKGLKDKDLGKVPTGSKIFLSNMGDAFGDWVPDAWIEAQIELAHKYPQYIFQFLTKNPERYGEFSFPSNCWLGTTVESDAQMWRLEKLCQKVHVDSMAFVSFEPLLGPVTHSIEGIDWAIIGELTGKPMTQEQIHEVRTWADAIIEQCDYADIRIPIFVKNALGAIFPQREFPRVNL